MNIAIRPHLIGGGSSVVLDDYSPSNGFEDFLKNLCLFLGEDFHYWHQGVMEGIGRIAYKATLVEIYWTDFPFSLNFECDDSHVTERLKVDLESYFNQSIQTL
jgi:hypothetical protein